MLKRQTAYTDLGAAHFERLDPDRLIRYHLTKLEALGRHLKLVPIEDAASITRSTQRIFEARRCHAGRKREQAGVGPGG